MHTHKVQIPTYKIQIPTYDFLVPSDKEVYLALETMNLQPQH